MTTILGKTVTAFKLGDWNLVLFGMLTLLLAVVKIAAGTASVLIMSYLSYRVFAETQPRHWGPFSLLWVIFLLVTIGADLAAIAYISRIVFGLISEVYKLLSAPFKTLKTGFDSLPAQDLRKSKEDQLLDDYLLERLDSDTVPKGLYTEAKYGSD